MANKKKKKAPKIKLTDLVSSMDGMKRVLAMHWEQIDGLIGTLVRANAKIMDLENNVDKLTQDLRDIRHAAEREAELRVQAESMVYRKLIHTLMADRKSVDIFLDRLSDLAPKIAKGVLVGTFEDVAGVESIRPDRADDPPSAS